MKRAVIDTNVFISAIGWGGLPLKILRLWKNQTFILITSLKIIEEIEHVVAELNLSNELWFGWKNLLFEQASIIETKHEPAIRLRDPHDIKFIETALWGGASYIVSGDKDLLELEYYQGVNIVSPRKFFQLVNSAN